MLVLKFPSIIICDATPCLRTTKINPPTPPQSYLFISEFSFYRQIEVVDRLSVNSTHGEHLKVDQNHTLALAVHTASTVARRSTDENSSVSLGGRKS